MKKLLLSVVAIMSATTLFSQDFIVRVCEDKIEKTFTYVAVQSVLVENEKESQGFLMSLYFEKKDDKVACTGITIKSVVGSSCVENSSLYLVLENDEIITMTAWNKFNCDATSYFDFTDEQISALSTHKIKAIRFKNGYDFATLTGMEKGSENFFVRAFNNVVLKPVNCN